MPAIKKHCQFFGYCEIEPLQETLSLNLKDETSLWETLKYFSDSSFKLARVSERGDVWEAFNHFFGGKLANV